MLTEGLARASGGGACEVRCWVVSDNCSGGKVLRSASEKGDTPAMVSKASRISVTKLALLLLLLESWVEGR